MININRKHNCSFTFYFSATLVIHNTAICITYTYNAYDAVYGKTSTGETFTVFTQLQISFCESWPC